MLLQTNSYVVPREKRVEHARLLRRFRQTLLRLGCDHFEVYEQTGPNWSSGDNSGRFVQIMRFRDRKQQLSVQNAERADPAAQALLREFCDLINLPYQQQQGYFAVGFYTSFMRMPEVRPHADSATHPAHEIAEQNDAGPGTAGDETAMTISTPEANSPETMDQPTQEHAEQSEMAPDNSSGENSVTEVNGSDPEAGGQGTETMSQPVPEHGERHDLAADEPGSENARTEVNTSDPNVVDPGAETLSQPVPEYAERNDPAADTADGASVMPEINGPIPDAVELDSNVVNYANPEPVDLDLDSLISAAPEAEGADTQSMYHADNGDGYAQPGPTAGPPGEQKEEAVKPTSPSKSRRRNKRNLQA